MRKVVVVLPHIRSTHNTGAFFRTADGAGVERIVLCGTTATPPHPHLIKVSLGAENTVPWTHINDPAEVISDLRSQGYQIVVVEQAPGSISYNDAAYAEKVALVFGHEVDGTNEELLHSADIIVDIPMRGQKESLNVSVAGGVMLYHLLQV